MLNYSQEIRRKSTKETSDLKEELRKKEQLKEAMVKRKEKQDDIAARKSIQAKIAADREDRRLKATKDEPKVPPYNSSGTACSESVAAAATDRTSSKPASVFTNTRLRFQIVATGSTLQMIFPVDTSLGQVATTVSAEAGVDISTFTQNYPRRIHDCKDSKASLKDLGLTPSAALIAK